MLDVALAFLARELNSYLRARTGSERVEIGRLVDDTGKWAITENHVRAVLVNIEEERTLKAQLPETTFVDGSQVTLEPALRLNLHVLFAAHFQQYDQALHFLSHVVTFFQGHPYFTPDRYPGLDPRLQRLTAELLPLGYEQLNQLWAYLGAKHLPSAVYRFRLVTVQDVEPTTVQPPVTSVESIVQSR